MGINAKKSAIFTKQNYTYWYWPDDDMERILTSFLERIKKDERYLEKIREDFYAAVQTFCNFLKELDTLSFDQLSDEKLFSLFDKFKELLTSWLSPVLTVPDAFSMYSSALLKKTFREKFLSTGLVENFEEHYSLLLSPVEESFLFSEKRSLLNILEKTKSAGGVKTSAVQELLKMHAKQFFWIRSNYAKQPLLDLDYFESALNKLLAEKVDPLVELDQMNTELALLKDKKEKLISSLELDSYHLNLIRAAELFSFLQDERKKYMLITLHYQRKYIEEIARRRGVGVREVEYMLYPETKKETFDSEDLKRRYEEGCMVVQDDNGYYVYTGKETEKIHDSVFSGVVADNTEELKGLCASRGVAKGPVKIVQKTHDLINFQEGDVLISSMTRPEMVTAMEKASAIVTDEGGVTSHAAVVSRELGIPCIIGTKSATKVFKDGDLVEVHADKGIVRKSKDCA